MSHYAQAFAALLVTSHAVAFSARVQSTARRRVAVFSSATVPVFTSDLDAEGLNPPNPFETDPEAAKPLVGTYAWSLAEADRFEVAWFDRFTCLQLKRAGGVARNLIPLGDSRFSPAGARHVVLSFAHEGERATQLLVPQIGGVLSCARVAG